jgi:hypothetical protein
VGTLTSWNPLGHSRPVTGLLYKAKTGTFEKPNKIEETVFQMINV